MITNKIKTPEDYCQAYLDMIYPQPISKLQVKGVSQAFHAGIEAACKFIHRHIADQQGIVDDEILVERLVRFRALNRQRALQLNQPPPTTTATKTND